MTTGGERIHLWEFPRLFVRRRGGLFCLDAATGKTLWETEEQQNRMLGYASVINAGNAWLFLTDRGWLIVARPHREKSEPIAEYQISNSALWAHPVLLDGRILIRDQTTLRSFTLRDENK